MGADIHVPRSAYADLADPRHVEVQSRGGVTIVRIEGGDGAEAYDARIFVDRMKVTRRTLSSPILEGRPTEETRYWTRVMKDE